MSTHIIKAILLHIIQVRIGEKYFFALLFYTYNHLIYSIHNNDTSGGLSSDVTYKLDHGWVTSQTRDTLSTLGSNFLNAMGKKIEVNDCTLIDGVDTPEHSTHTSGKEIDIRNSGMSAAEEKKFLEICVADANVSRVLFYTKHGLTSSKIIVRADHSDHFHVDTVN